MRLSLCAVRTVKAGPAMRAMSGQSGWMAYRMTQERSMTSEIAVVGSPWKPLTTSGAGRGMSRRMACAGSVMASLREFEEKPGAPRAGDGGGQRPVREHHVAAGQRKPLQPGMGELGLEAIALAEGVEKVGQRDAGRHGLRPARQHRDRIVDAGEHDDEVHGRPRGGLRARAEEQDEAADQEPDDQRAEKAPQEEEGERAG